MLHANFSTKLISFETTMQATRDWNVARCPQAEKSECDNKRNIYYIHLLMFKQVIYKGGKRAGVTGNLT